MTQNFVTQKIHLISILAVTCTNAVNNYLISINVLYCSQLIVYQCIHVSSMYVSFRICRVWLKLQLIVRQCIHVSAMSVSFRICRVWLTVNRSPMYPCISHVCIIQNMHAVYICIVNNSIFFNIIKPAANNYI